MADSPNNKPTGRGGARPGAGRKPGKMEAATIERMKVIEAFRERVAKNADRLFNSQMTIAEGTSYLYCIHTDSKGVRQKAELVTAPSVIQAYLDGELDDSQDDYYYITTERPDNRAIDSMLDRAFGKPTQPLSGDPDGAPLTVQLVKYGDDPDTP